jgi:ATP-dependent DNA ligase
LSALLGNGAASATPFAFDFLLIDVEDLRRLPTLERKARLAKLLRKAPAAIRYVEHLEGGRARDLPTGALGSGRDYLQAQGCWV